MSDYHRMPIAQKRTEALARSREHPVTCRTCGTQVTKADLLAHRPRCPGRTLPHVGAKWIAWAEALSEGRKHGVSKKAVWGWVNRGLVRLRGEIGAREYLYGDLVEQIDQLLNKRRR